MKYSKNAPKWFSIFSFPFTRTSLLRSSPPSLSIGDYTIGKTFHFHLTSLIGSKVTLCSFVVFLFFSFLMFDCLEMLVKVLGFRIVWLGGKYEKAFPIVWDTFLLYFLSWSSFLKVCQVFLGFFFFNLWFDCQERWGKDEKIRNIWNIFLPFSLLVLWLQKKLGILVWSFVWSFATHNFA